MYDDDPKNTPAARYSLSVLLRPPSLLRLGLIGGAMAAVVVCFAWAAGWLAPGRLDQARIINAFEAANGPQPGFRRNHAKGVCLTGWFDSNGAAAGYSRAVVFRPGRVPVFGRFALAGGMPRAPDNPKTVRSMALNFNLPNGEVWRTGMNDIPVFTVNTAQGFYDQQIANMPDPKTHKPDPLALKAFLAAHPEAVRATNIIKAHPFAADFANSTFNSLNAFRFLDTAGHATPVRWAMVPEDQFVPEAAVPPQGANYLFDQLIARIDKGPARWHLIVTIGQPGDPTRDVTVLWRNDRKKIDAGTLTVTGIASEATGNCRDINFDPLVLPAGITPSDDPLLSLRSAAYAVSFTRRAGEPKMPSAVQLATGRAH